MNVKGSESAQLRQTAVATWAIAAYFNTSRVDVFVGAWLVGRAARVPKTRKVGWRWTPILHHIDMLNDVVQYRASVVKSRTRRGGRDADLLHGWAIYRVFGGVDLARGLPSS